MMNLLKKWLGLAAQPEFKSLIQQGARIIDVRTKAEFQQGHVQGAVNIPLNNLADHYAKMKKDMPVITCCASGIRSAQAKNMLFANGFTRVYNGGGWMSLKRKLD